MTKKSVQRSILAASLVFIAFVLVACGNQSSSSKKPQVLNLAAEAPLPTIDLAKSTGYGQTGNIYESFFRLGKNGKATPGLAKTATESRDGKTWTFKLRDAKWSNGDKIKAQDFVYSWRRTLTPSTKAEYAYLFEGIKNATAINQGKMNPNKLGIEATDDKTVVVHLDKPIAYFKILMAYPLFAPQNQKAVEKYGKKYATKSEYMVYSGPFKLKNWNGTGNKWTFVKNNQYWDKKVVKLSRVNYTVVSSLATSLDLYRQKKLDLTELSSEQVKNYKNDSQFKKYPYSQIFYLKYNFKDDDATIRKALNNRDIRLAFSLAVDRKTLTKSAMGDDAQVPNGFVPSGLASYDGKDFAESQTVKNTVTYNKKLAKQHWEKGLKAIGAKNLKMTLVASNDDPVTSTVTQYLKAQFEKVLPGFTLDIRSVPSQTANQYGQRGDFDITLSGWGADFNDPISFLQIPMTGTSYNYGKYSNKAYDKLVKKADNEDANNPAKRWQDLLQASRLFNEDQGMTPLYQNETSFLQRSDVKGIIHNTAGAQWSYKYAYVK
ncbi:peptide ABC transporter substrate-binding protein [Secundilactobacillus oryzae]|nr:peptide ABC transporter substrate-binding protein [Secundilactobacillus oryzae]